jgi:hypothetical protein
MKLTLPAVSVAAVLLLLASGQGTPTQNSAPFELDSLTISGFRWRSIGPANMQGRVSDVAGIPSPSKTLFAAAAAGGIWKSTNNGVTWRPVFDNERVARRGQAHPQRIHGTAAGPRHAHLRIAS